MSGEQVPGCMGRGLGVGAWWLPAGGIRASQGTFSSSTCLTYGWLRSLNTEVQPYPVNDHLLVRKKMN